jgi:hypothetical protein
VLDNNNNLVGLSSSRIIYWYILTPDNQIISNDPNITQSTFNSGIGTYSATPIVEEEEPGVYYINYVLTKVGEYKYKFQIQDDPTLTKVAVSGDIKVITDGIF